MATTRSATVTTETIDLNGPVNVARFRESDHFGGSQNGPVILIHGLGGSCVNWIAMADLLAEHGPVVAPDLVGFGLTPPRGRRSTVETNADLIVDLIHYLGSKPALLVGNSMGGLISLLVARANPELVRGVVLLDPALPMRRPNLDPRGLLQLFGPHLPILALAAARKVPFGDEPENLMITGLKLLVADPASISDEVLGAHMEVARKRLRMPWVMTSFLEAGKSTVEKLLSRQRFRQMCAAIDAPVLLIHGKLDRLIPVSAARWMARAQPDWTYEFLDGVGHIPQLEVPEVVARVVGIGFRLGLSPRPDGLLQPALPMRPARHQPYPTGQGSDRGPKRNRCRASHWLSPR